MCQHEQITFCLSVFENVLPHALMEDDMLEVEKASPDVGIPLCWS